MRKKNLQRCYSVVTALLLAVVLFSCKGIVGLGEVVDTGAPTITFTSPSADGLVFKDSVTVTGTYTDDVGVKSVTLELYNIANDTETLVKSYTAALTASAEGSASGIWSVSIDTDDFGDGTYTLKAYGTDGSFTSTKVSRSLDIDNTPPVFLISSPNSVSWGENYKDAASYGTALTITGAVSDKHSVTKMNVIIKKDGAEVLNKDFIDFDSQDLSVTVADLKGSDELKSNYTAIYGSDDSAGNQYYELTVSLTDKAGNTSTYAYIKESLTDAIKTQTGLSSSSYGAADLRDILNGTYSRSAISTDNQKIIKSILSDSSYKTDSSKTLKVKLNANVNPTYSFSDNKVTTKDGSETFTTVASGSYLAVNLNKGGDGYNIVPGTLKAYFTDAITGSVTEVNSDHFTNSEGTAVSSISTSVGSADYRVYPNKSDSDKVTVGRNYYVTVTGQDTNGVDLVSSDGKYGFTLVVTGNGPKVEWDKDKDYIPSEYSYNRLDKFKTFHFTGSITSDSDVQTETSKWTLKLKNMAEEADDISISGLFTFSDSTWDTGNIYEAITSDSTYGSSIEKALSSSAYYMAELGCTFKNETSNEASLSRTFNIDTIKPVITFNKYTDTENDKVNGKITLSASVEDTGKMDDRTVYLKVSSSDGKEEDITSTKVLDTASYVTDTGSITVTATATDTAGNLATSSLIIYVDQTKDKPLITLSNVTSNGITEGSTENVFGIDSNNTLQGTVTDDDGIASITIKTRLHSSSTSWDSITGTSYASLITGSTSQSLSIGLKDYIESLAEGQYDIRIEAEDNKKETNYSSNSSEYTFAVDKGAPVFSSVTPVDNTYVSSAITVSGNITDGTDVSLTYSIDGSSASPYVMGSSIDIASLKDGDHKVVLTAKDYYGQSSSYTVNFNVDTVAPVITNGSGFTKDYISIAENSSTYDKLMVNVTEEGSGIDSVKYTFTNPETSDSAQWIEISGSQASGYTANIEFTRDSDVSKTVYVKATDKSGKESKVESYTVKIDNTAPQSGLSLEGTFKDGDGNDITSYALDSSVYYTKDGYKLSGTIVEENIASASLKCGSNTVWSYDGTSGLNWSADNSNAQEGTYAYVLSIKDKADNSYTGTFSVVVDKSAPVLTVSNEPSAVITEQDNNYKKSTDTDGNTTHYYILSGSWSDANGRNSIEYKTDSGEWIKADVSASSAKWSIDIPLNSEGSGKSIALRATDIVGNISKDITYSNLTYDFTAPSITILTDAATYSSQSSTISGSVSDTNIDTVSVTAYLNSSKSDTAVAVTLDSDKTSWSFIPPSTEGKWYFEVTAIDTAGRTARVKTAETTVDSTAPALKTTLDSDTDYTNKASRTVEVYIEENGSGVSEVSYSLYEGEGTATLESSGTFSPNTSKDKDGYHYYSSVVGCTDGVHTLTLSAKDNAGNGGEVLSSVVYKIDTVSPVIDSVSLYADVNDIMTEVDYVKSDTKEFIYLKPSITESNDISYVELLKNGKSIKKSDWTSEMEYIAVPSDYITDGDGYYQIQTCDKAGNKSDQTTVEIKCDTKGPGVVIGSTIAGSTTESGLITVDKKISLSGTVTDATSGVTQGATGSLYYLNGDEYKSVDNVTLTIGDNSTWTGDFDTQAFGISGKVSFKAVFTDNYGNSNLSDSSSGVFTLNIDQNQDRPIIDVSSVSGKYITSTVSGTVTDYDGITVGDDTLKMWYISKLDYTEGSVPSDSDSKWKEVSVTSSSSTSAAWSFALSSDESEGDTTWYFYVTDSKSGSFCTQSDSELSRPYFVSSSSLADSKDGVSCIIDINKPELGAVYYYESDDASAPALESTEWKLYTTSDSNLYLGGTTQYLFFKLSASDTNGIASFTIADSKETDSTSITSGSDGSVISSYIDKKASNFSGEHVYTFTAKDNSGKVSESSTARIFIDTQSPEVTLSYPSASDYISTAINANGIISDNPAGGSGTAKVYWKVAKKNETLASPVEDTISDSDISMWHAISSTSTWKIPFIWNSEEDNPYNLSLYKDTEVYASETKGSGLIEVPVTFYVEDNAGNYGFEEVAITIDPDSDIPKSSIIYPTAGTKLGGQIRIYGSATDNVSVSSVYIQIDADGDGDFDDTDKSIVSGWDGFTDGITLTGSSESTWGLLTSGNSSWNITLNKNKELTNLTSASSEETQAVNKTSEFYVRAVAVDNNGNFGKAWSDTVSFYIDNDVPSVGTVYLSQYDDGIKNSATASQLYTSDLWIKGKWYIDVDLVDENGIKEISFEKTTGSSSTLDGITLVEDAGVITEYNDYVTSVTDSESNTSGYHVRFPIDSSYCDSDGNISCTIVVVDNTDQNNTARQSLSINIDNTAPYVYTADGRTINSSTSSLRLMQGGYSSDTTAVLSDTKLITQSNDAFTFGDIVEESGSGFERVVFYFKRVSSDSEESSRIYDPMVTYDSVTGSGRLDIGDDISINDDDLPVMSVKGSLTSESSFSGTINTTYVRTGGIVKIDGLYRTISSVTSSGITFTPAAGSYDESAVVEADFVTAQVVDHVAVETSKTDGTIANDDGDGMVESVERTGSSYEWTATVNAKNMSDGPIQVHTVTFDAAGNMTHGYVDTQIQNNRPRIAKVYLGTDLNGDGDYTTEAGEFTSYATGYEYSNRNANDRGYVTTLNGSNGTQDSSNFKAVDNLIVVPEFVGNINNGISYIYDIKDNTEGDAESLTKAAESDSLIDMSEGDFTDFTTTEGSITVASACAGYALFTSDTLSTACADIEGKGEGSKILIRMSFWDHTEETTAGSTSQNAVLNIPLTVNVNDSEKPESSISGLTSYNNNAEYGHTGLDAGWYSDSYTGAVDSSTYISGKVTFSGSFTDNRRLGEVYADLTDFTLKSGSASLSTSTIGEDSSAVKLASYTGGKWVYTAESASLETEGFEFKITDGGVTQEGHSATWTLSFDTASPNGPYAASDLVLNVYAKDSSSNNLYGSSSKTVSIVPYITGITRTSSSSSTTDTYRSTYGQYPVATGDTLTVTGFNLPKSSTTTDSSLTTWVKVGTTQVATESSVSGESFTLTVPDNSGELTVSVGGIDSINSSNNNAAVNNLDSDGLYDDRYIRVWDVGHYMTGSVSQDNPTMAVDKTGNIFSTYANMGSGLIEMQKGLSGTSKAVFVSYDQPDKETYLAADEKSGSDLSLIYFPAHVGNGGYGDVTGYADTNTIGGAWGSAIPDDISSITNSFTTNKKYLLISIDKNYYYQMDKNYSSGYQLASYGMIREVSKFSQGRTARYGDNLHYVYYDSINKALRYTYQYADGTSGSTDKCEISGWTLIDGGTDGRDRIHKKGTYDQIGLTVSSVSGSGSSYKVTLGSAVSASKGDTLAITYDSTTGRRKLDIFTVSADVSSSKTVKITGSFSADVNTYSGAAIYSGDSNVLTKSGSGIDSASSAGSYSAIDVTTEGYPVIVYKAGDGLRLAYCNTASPSMQVSPGSKWTRKVISGTTGGTYVQAKIDGDNYLHIVYVDSSNNLMYLKSANSSTTGAYTFGTPELISENNGTYATISLIKSGTSYVPCVSFLNSEGNANGVKFAIRNNTALIGSSNIYWDVMIVPAVNGRYVAGSELVYCAGQNGSWTANSSSDTDSVDTSKCDAIVGYDTDRMDVLFLKSEQ